MQTARLMALRLGTNRRWQRQFVLENPFPWSAEIIYLKKNENFFETTVTEYGKLSNLQEAKSEEELFEGIEV